jgi:hypothetical protein
MFHVSLVLRVNSMLTYFTVQWCFDRLNFSAAAAIYMGISCDRSAERWKSPEMIEKICYSHEFKLAKMGKVREIQPYYESHLLQAELFDPGFDVPGGRKKKSYYGLIMKDKYNEHRPFVPHLGTLVYYYDPDKHRADLYHDRHVPRSHDQAQGRRSYD